MFRYVILVAGLALASLTPPALAAEARCANADRFTIITAGDVAFARAIQSALASGDRAWLAEHVRYPLRVTTGDRVDYVETRAEFLRRFETLFAAEVNAAILATDATCMFKKDAQVMMGTGQLWFVEYPAFASPTTRYLIHWLNFARPLG